MNYPVFRCYKNPYKLSQQEKDRILAAGPDCHLNGEEIERRVSDNILDFGGFMREGPERGKPFFLQWVGNSKQRPSTIDPRVIQASVGIGNKAEQRRALEMIWEGPDGYHCIAVIRDRSVLKIIHRQNFLRALVVDAKLDSAEEGWRRHASSLEKPAEREAFERLIPGWVAEIRRVRQQIINLVKWRIEHADIAG